jgi:lactonase
VRSPVRIVLAAAVLVLLALTGVAAAGGPRDRSTAPGGPERDTIARSVLTLHGPGPAGAPLPVPEGPAFDRNGELYFVSVYGDADGNKVFRADLDTGVVTPLYSDAASVFTSLVVHRDGSLYLADYLGGPGGTGRIVRMDPAGGRPEVVVDSFGGAPIFPDDMVFDAAGNLYISDMTGNALDPTGRVLRWSPGGAMSEVASGLAFPNGIALSAEQDELWVSENLGNRLFRLDIDENGAIVPGAPGSGISVFAHFSGGSADSTTVDGAGNVYQAMYLGGRAEVLDEAGNPLAVVRPDGGLEEWPNTTHVVIRPGSTEAFLLAGGPEGAELFRFDALAEGLVPFSHT